MSYLKDPERFNQMGTKPPHGVLLEGPPGCGKVVFLIPCPICVLIARDVTTDRCLSLPGPIKLQSSGSSIPESYSF